MVKDNNTLQYLVRKAIELGVSDAKIIPAKAVCVEERFARMCESPQCSNYGLSINCPPHVMKTDEFKKSLSQYDYALVFKIDAPTDMLLSEDRRVIARLVHEISATIEKLAIEAGCVNSKGLAAGSCKRIFCEEYVKCKVLEDGSQCLFPDLARPSMSGLGINFNELTKTLGWQFNKITGETNPDDVPMGMLAGMVLIGGREV